MFNGNCSHGVSCRRCWAVGTRSGWWLRRERNPISGLPELEIEGLVKSDKETPSRLYRVWESLRKGISKPPTRMVTPIDTSSSPNGMITSEATAPWVNNTFQNAPELTDWPGGMTKFEIPWLNRAKIPCWDWRQILRIQWLDRHQENFGPVVVRVQATAIFLPN